MKSKTLFIFTFLSIVVYANTGVESCINAHLQSKFNIDKSQHIDARRELMALIKKNNKRI